MNPDDFINFNFPDEITSLFQNNQNIEAAAVNQQKLENNSEDFLTRLDILNSLITGELSKLKTLYTSEKEPPPDKFDNENDQKLFNYIKNNNFECSNIPPNVLVKLVKHLINLENKIYK